MGVSNCYKSCGAHRKQLNDVISAHLSAGRVHKCAENDCTGDCHAQSFMNAVITLNCTSTKTSRIAPVWYG